MLMENTPSTRGLESNTHTDQGSRAHNADAAATYLDPVTGQRAFAVADGIGDSTTAAHAARLAADVVARTATRTGTVGAVLAARDAVRDWMPSDSRGFAGDAVLVAATLLPEHLGGGFSVSWVGDCRAYLWQDGAVTLLTTDQTAAQYFRDRGAPVTPRLEHLVTNSVRQTRLETMGHLRTRSGWGRLVLTTDGVHRPLGDVLLRELIARPGDGTGLAEVLVNAALRAGGTDDATALVVDAPRARRVDHGALTVG